MKDKEAGKTDAKLFLDLGHGFVDEESISISTDISTKQYYFDISVASYASNFCFSPYKGDCIIKFVNVEVFLLNNEVIIIDEVSTNAIYSKKNILYFIDETPKFIFNIDRKALKFKINAKILSTNYYKPELLLPGFYKKVEILNYNLKNSKKIIQKTQFDLEYLKIENNKKDAFIQDKDGIIERLQSSAKILESDIILYKNRYEDLNKQIYNILNSLTWRSARLVLDPLEKIINYIKNFKNKSVINLHKEKNYPKEITNFPFFPPSSLERGSIYNREPELLIVSHDASRTGAPLIILNIAKILVQHYKVKCVFILLSGGVLLNQFQELGEVYILHEWQTNKHHYTTPIDEIVRLMLENHNVRFALLNSAESHPISISLRKIGIHYIALIHEFALQYAKGLHFLSKIVNFADEVIFPAQIVLNSAQKMLPKTNTPMSICPQGLLDSSFPRGTREEAHRTIRSEIGSTENTFIVLGCGYVDTRKGCDIFVSIAKQIKKTRPEAPIEFIWVGEMFSDKINKYSSEQNVFLCNLKNKLKNPIYKHVHFIGERQDPSAWFLGADCFLMCSRLDPFPCVVLEAMAACLPVICFEGTTGSVDAIGHEAGFILPRFDETAVCEKIFYIYDHPEIGRTLGKKGKKIIQEHYDYNKYVDKIFRKIQYYAPKFFGKNVLNSEYESRKIIIPCNSWGLSGVNTLLETFGEYLIKYGWDVKIIFTECEYIIRKYSHDNLPQKIPFEFFLLPENCSIKDKWRYLISYYENNSPCIMLTGFDYNANSIAPALSDTIGVVIWNHADNMEYYEQAHRLGLYANRMIAVSNEIAKKIEQMNPRLAERTIVIPNACINEDSIFKKRSYTFGPIKLIYAGRYVQYQKRVRDFAELVLALEDKKINYELTLVGEDHDGSGEYLKEKLHKQIKEGRIKILGRKPREKILAMFAQNDVLLLLSDFEGMPLIVVEAMSQGCVPMVAQMKSGIPEIITQSNGIIMTSRNYSLWAEKIAILASEDKKYIKKMSLECIASIKENFTIEKTIPKLDMLFATVWKEIISEKYKRPETLKWDSKTGDVLPPQNT